LGEICSRRRAILLESGTTSIADDVTDSPASAPVGASCLGGISYSKEFDYDAANGNATGRAHLTERIDSAHASREIGTIAHTIYTLDP
jgi:hypothetical protein